MEPLQPPITLEQMTKYLSVSSALPGPMSMSHQPGSPVVGAVKTRHVGVAGQGVGDEDGVVLALAERAVGLVGDGERRQRAAALEGELLPRLVEGHVPRADDAGVAGVVADARRRRRRSRCALCACSCHRDPGTWAAGGARRRPPPILRVRRAVEVRRRLRRPPSPLRPWPAPARCRRRCRRSTRCRWRDARSRR